MAGRRWSVRGSRLAAALTLICAGCQFAGTNTHNLDQLHWSDGRHKRTGDLWTDYEYAVRAGLRGLVRGFGADVAATTPEEIDDPLEECVDNLLDLLTCDADDAQVAAQQIEYCTRLAVDDPWHLTREIAVRALGRLGARLRMAEHAPAAPAGEVATPEVIRDLLQRLIRTSGPVLRGNASGDEQAEFDGVCGEIRGLALDRDGATRLLRSLVILSGLRDADDARGAPLRSLTLELERTCVRLALESALRDEPPGERGGSYPGWRNARVRAAAIEAAVEAWGEPMSARLLADLSPRDPDRERLLAYMRVVRRYGLPEPPSVLSQEQRGIAQEAWTAAIYHVATGHPDGEVRLAAMAALGRLSGREPYSVREEEWQAWWLARQATSAGNGTP